MFWNRLTRGLGTATLFFFLVSIYSPLWNYVGGKLSRFDDVQASDAIVVLGGGFFGKETLNDDSLRRWLHGILLYKRGLAPLLILSGRSDDPGTLSEGRIRSSLAQAMGVPLEAILVQETANTTHEESLHIAELLKSYRSSRVLLVTESLHMRRAASAFERAGFRVVAAPSDEYSKVLASPRERLWLMTRVSQEAFALVYYRMAGYI